MEAKKEKQMEVKADRSLCPSVIGQMWLIYTKPVFLHNFTKMSESLLIILENTWAIHEQNMSLTEGRLSILQNPWNKLFYFYFVDVTNNNICQVVL